MDSVDKKIIERLSSDARTPFLTISKELGVSEGTIRQRVSKLLKSGAIRKFTLELGSATTAVVEITTSSEVPTHKISEKIRRLGVEKVFEVTGRLSIIAIIQTSDAVSLNRLLEEIRAIDGVEQTETFSVLKDA